MPSSASLDPRLLVLASGLAIAAFAPQIACGSGTSPTGSSSSSSGGTTSETTGSGGSSSSSTTTASAQGGGGSGGSGTGGTMSGSTSSTGSGTGGTDTWPACHACLQTECATEVTACDDGCIAIQACLDTVCSHLSAIGSSDEGNCQVYCQTQHFGSKDEHLDLVNCVQMASDCMPPCALAGYDWNQCVDERTDGECKPLIDACTNDMNCTEYLGCTLTCSTYNECKACFSTPEGQAGRALYEAYWVCVETSCLPEYWLPHL